MRRSQILSGAIILCLLICATVRAAPPAQPLVRTLSRSDVVAALERFERAYAAHRPDGDKRARIHRGYDEATLFYFEGKHAECIRVLNELSESLAPAAQRHPADALIHALQVRLSPPVALRRPGLLRARVGLMYPVPLEGPVDLRFTIRADAPGSQPVLDEPLRIDLNGPPAALTRAQPEVPMGRYLIELIGPDGTAYPAGRWSVVETPLDMLRLTNDRTLVSLQPTSVEMIHAVVACRSRNMLVSDRIDENSPAQFLADPVLLSREVQSEVGWLASGKDPYKGRAGDWWRGIIAGQMQFPARVYAPRAVADGKPMPLIIALHGSGGDESIFMDMMGNGQIRKLADEHGFVVAAPNTLWVSRSLAALDATIEAMSCIYPIDASRIYLIGHGLGAATAVEMASRQPEKVAKLALFSGGAFGSVRKLPPARLYVGSIDRIYRAPSVGGLPVEIELVENAGHTLVVHDLLPQAVEWLLKP